LGVIVYHGIVYNNETVIPLSEKGVYFVQYLNNTAKILLAN